MKYNVRPEQINIVYRLLEMTSPFSCKLNQISSDCKYALGRTCQKQVLEEFILVTKGCTILPHCH